MKLDISYMRYLTPEDFKVLKGVEQGSKNHEVVPTSLINNLSGLKSPSATNKSIADLAKLKLISKHRNSKYDGYKLTYNGIDYLAMNSLLLHDTIYSIGHMIGIGKESDIYKVSDKSGNTRVMKIHRLGRTSFQTVKNNRDYLKKNSKIGTNWMVLSGLAALKEYQFMSILYSNDFKVPKPFDNSRHIIIMELIEGYPMRRLRSKNQLKLAKLYNELMCFIVKLADHGLIHCDFNEFNIMIKEINNSNTDNNTTYTNKNKNSDDFDLDFTVIDFPQCISINHAYAEYYFKRDVDCIRRFFKKKLKFEPIIDDSMVDVSGFGNGFKYPYPVFERDVTRTHSLDKLLKASGYNQNANNNNNNASDSLEDAIDGMRNHNDYNSDSETNDGYSSEDSKDEYGYSDEYSDEESSEEEDDQDEENERIIEALSSGVTNLKMDKLGNYILDD
ncbi:hypothetical protein TBLA_0G00370 [Henningerozyma blattae CBS 6284]|uniref:Serine/threonine-protein kinase RIO2 n=1 Tax=Henningerozyma blattae (strain ATCC 34711 / CBS 6284 / DSM 70876 / NBRC 10599 / NRRL Y-10934 / UCD 77-7) TaxID=1071380 RepID=I2H6I4_HENB6|nr:hypothetical protein TBLA_0G00370 [Tetrapisispora blattae CBS 6284]CCH61986.1 hypothetical protein TBLA_0G00370 [Tetrapisispora blattae CBS 6284]